MIFPAQMADKKHLRVVLLPDLRWPELLQMQSKRFRLFVAADTSDVGTDTLSQFVVEALQRGMVYCCLWGKGCERFHDIVDDVVVEDELNDRRYVGPTSGDVIMTTWHSDESLEEALEFFTTALPTQGFLADSDYWLVACVGNEEWVRVASRAFESDPASD
jgi:hypothetical protein